MSEQSTPSEAISPSTLTSNIIPWAWIKQVKHLVDRPTSPKPVPVEILPWLYLSDERNVFVTARLRKLGITHVLAVNSMPDYKVQEYRERFENAGMTYKHCPGEDEEDYDMIGLHWEECRHFLQGVRESGGKAIVHCVAGINRSGLIVTAAHMVLEGRPLLEVVQHGIQQRGSLLWNRFFQKQLCMLAAKEGLLGNKPEGQTDDPIVSEPLKPPPIRSALDQLAK